MLIPLSKNIDAGAQNEVAKAEFNTQHLLELTEVPPGRQVATVLGELAKVKYAIEALETPNPRLQKLLGQTEQTLKALKTPTLYSYSQNVIGRIVHQNVQKTLITQAPAVQRENLRATQREYLRLCGQMRRLCDQVNELQGSDSRDPSFIVADAQNEYYKVKPTMQQYESLGAVQSSNLRIRAIVQKLRAHVNELQVSGPRYSLSSGNIESGSRWEIAARDISHLETSIEALSSLDPIQHAMYASARKKLVATYLDKHGFKTVYLLKYTMHGRTAEDEKQGKLVAQAIGEELRSNPERMKQLRRELRRLPEHRQAQVVAALCLCPQTAEAVLDICIAELQNPNLSAKDEQKWLDMSARICTTHPELDVNVSNALVGDLVEITETKKAIRPFFDALMRVNPRNPHEAAKVMAHITGAALGDIFVAASVTANSKQERETRDAEAKNMTERARGVLNAARAALGPKVDDPNLLRGFSATICKTLGAFPPLKPLDIFGTFLRDLDNYATEVENSARRDAIGDFDDAMGVIRDKMDTKLQELLGVRFSGILLGILV